MTFLSEQDHLADCEYAAVLRRLARSAGFREGWNLDMVEEVLGSLQARLATCEQAAKMHANERRQASGRLRDALARPAAAETLLRRVASGEETAIIRTSLLEEIELFLGKEPR